MWSHYSNSYRGFCIEVNVKSAFPNRNIEVLMKVNYCENRVVFPYDFKNLPLKDMQKIGYDLLTTKDNIWAYEKEHRVIASLNSLTPINQPIENELPIYTKIISPEHILTIIFGINCDRNDIDFVKNWIHKHKANHIVLKEISLCDDSFKLMTKNL